MGDFGFILIAYGPQRLHPHEILRVPETLEFLSFHKALTPK